MLKIRGGFFSGGGTVPLAGSARRPVTSPQLSQAPRVESQRLIDARRVRDEAVKNLTSAEDNLSTLEFTMGPEAALQAIDEGKDSVDRAQKEYDRILAEESP